MGQIKIIPVYKYLDKYINSLKNSMDNAEYLWEKYAIKPFWNELCQYAPFDLSERKPKCIKDVECLKKQIDLLNEIDLEKVQKDFEHVVNILPNYDDDPLIIALYPLSNENETVNNNQNGVIGTSLFGNNLICINPLVEGYNHWISYVFAHEYHHTVWGNYWFVMNKGKQGNKFINSLVIDGEADSFALSLNPSLKPKWLFNMSNEEIQKLWEKYYKHLVLEEDVDYNKYMFGDKDIPWCSGYAIGYWLVQKYLDKNKNKTFKEVIEIKPMDILKKAF